MIIEIESTRLSDGKFITNETSDNPFVAENGDFDEAKYITYGEFTFYECNAEDEESYPTRGNKIAVLKFTALKETEICNDGLTLFLLADSISADLINCIGCLDDKNIEDIKCSEDDLFRDTSIVVIDRLFVEEAYRKQGVATMILGKLRSLLVSHFNLYSRLWLTCVKPDGADIENAKEHPMYKDMVSLIERCGFVPTDEDRVYGFNVSLHEPFSGAPRALNLSEECGLAN